MTSASDSMARATDAGTNADRAALRAEVLDSVEAVEEYRDLWTEWQHHPNAHIDHFLAIVDSRSEIVRPHVLVIRENETPVAMLVGRVEDVPLDLRIGYKSLLRPRMRTLRVLYGGMLGTFSKATCELVIDELAGALKRREVGNVLLYKMKVGSDLHVAAKTRLSGLVREHFTVPAKHWRISLTGSFDDYLAELSKNVRKRVRQATNRVKKGLGDSLSIERLPADGQLDTAMQDMDSVASKSYQRALGVGFRNDDETRRTMSLNQTRNSLHSYVAYVDGTAAAFDRGCRWGRTIFLEEGAFDPEYERYGLGTFLLMREIRDAIESDGVTELDFGFGDSSYKQSYCNECWEEVSLFVFPASMRGLWWNSLKSLCNAANGLAKRMLESTGRFDRVRRFWRKRVSGGRKNRANAPASGDQGE